jgi:prophage regulatory protein
MAILRISEVKRTLGFKSNTSVYVAMSDGLLTSSIPVGERARGWPDHEVETIAAARIAGRSDAEIRELVKQLHHRRGERLAALLAA